MQQKSDFCIICGCMLVCTLKLYYAFQLHIHGVHIGAY